MSLHRVKQKQPLKSLESR